MVAGYKADLRVSTEVNTKVLNLLASREDMVLIHSQWELYTYIYDLLSTTSVSTFQLPVCIAIAIIVPKLRSPTVT